MPTHPHHYIGFVTALAGVVLMVRAFVAITRINAAEAAERKDGEAGNDGAVLKEVGKVVLAVLIIIWCFDDLMHLGGLLPG